MADPKPLYREIVELERQLRELLRANPLNAQDANALRARLVEKAEAIAAASAPFAAAKEIEQVLWKPCFYRRIEDFRRRIRKYAAASAGDRSAREHFARVSTEFQHFLAAAAGFYERLRAAYAAWLRANSDAAASGRPDAAKCRQSLHRCFIFLGDLARYRELHSQKAKKNFAAAEGFYHRALALAPENGNPHNQLAVLATYTEAETVAVYRYCRSLLTAQPFATAEENLALLFERTRQRPLAGPSALALTSASSAKDKSAFLKSFLHRLARLHGLLFSVASAGSAPAPAAYPREMEGLLFKDLDALLRAGAIGDALLLKLVVTNVFCVVRALRGAAGGKEDAFRLSARTVTSVMEYVTAALSATKPVGVSTESLSSLRLLGPVSVFCDVLRLNPEMVDVLDAELSSAEAPGGYQNSLRAFLEAFAGLVNHAALKDMYAPLASLRNDQQEPLRAQQLALKENVELRGFSPLAAMLDKPPTGLTWTNGESAETPSVPEATAARLRAWNLFAFGKFLCEEYEGNPLLYLYQGVFSTAPTVGGGGVANSFLQAVAGSKEKSLSVGQMPAFTLFGVSGAAPPQQQRYADGGAIRSPAKHQADADDDDFDDEVIVFQPSPALTPMPAPSGDASASWMASPFADLSAGGPFSLGAPISQSTPEPKRNSFSDSFNSSGFGGGAIGSSLGYPSFQSFGGDFGGFSGQGLLSGWGNSEPLVAAGSNGLGRPPSVPKPTGAFAGLSSAQFSPMLDLAAVERESALYQQEESSLSAFFGSSAPRSSSASSLSDSSSARTPPLRSPPPGFDAPSLGVAQGGIVQARLSDSGANQAQFRTRNPFVNP